MGELVQVKTGPFYVSQPRYDRIEILIITYKTILMLNLDKLFLIEITFDIISC